MKKDVVIAGLLGGVVMFFWLLVSNAMLPFKSELIHKRIPLPNQIELHQALKANITENGTYSVPYLSHEEEPLFANYRSQPVYAITYEGVTHSQGAPMTPTPFVVIFLVPMIAAWMLSETSAWVRSSYFRRVVFVVAMGVIIALFDDVLQMSFGPQPQDYLVFIAVNNVITWVLAGLVIAWKIKPRTV